MRLPFYTRHGYRVEGEEFMEAGIPHRAMRALLPPHACGAGSVITDPVFYLLAAIGVLLSGISKGGFAGAFGGLAVALMCLRIAPQQAAAIMLPVLLAMDAFGLYAFFRKIDRKVLLSLLPGGIAGTVLGTVTFGALDVNWVRVVVGIIAVSFPLMMWLRVGANRPPAHIHHGKALLCGAGAGYNQFCGARGCSARVVVFDAAATRQAAFDRHQRGVFRVFEHHQDSAVFRARAILVCQPVHRPGAVPAGAGGDQDGGLAARPDFHRDGVPGRTHRLVWHWLQAVV